MGTAGALTEPERPGMVAALAATTNPSTVQRGLIRKGPSACPIRFHKRRPTATCSGRWTIFSPILQPEPGRASC